MTDTGGQELCRDDVPNMVLSGTGQQDTRGSHSPEPLARRRWGWGHRTNPASASHVWTHHSFPSVGCGGKAPGAHHSQNAVEDPAVSPRAPCPGSDEGPWATGSRKPDFGSQSTNEQHSQMKGPTNLHLPDSFPLWGAGQERRLPVHRVLCLVPEQKLNPGCHQGQPERWWMMG